MDSEISLDNSEESGWDRLKALAKINEDGSLVYEIEHVPNVVYYGSMFGFLYGGQFGWRIRTRYYKKHNQLTIYRHAMDAQRELHSAKIIGFVKYGCRWGWRMGLFSGLYSLLIAGSSVYRDRSDALNYIGAGAVTGAIYKIFGGWRSMMVASAICAGVSAPIGLLAQAGNFFVGEEIKKQQQEEKEEKERLLHEKKQQDLQATKHLIESMEKELKEQDKDSN